ncbi:hypothetical protein [Rhodovibrio salinarum]|uniref:Uncharacterized protein n=1 Tax=Rhodovibrio salinarum TaxID=1087 RepID=A0A934UYK3_9PROT|nr:hypothetical protein [Rhodovibrio salinarum]MBK1696192.1 hypothetical protein [Rhodovibrio salinarum]
MGQLDYKLAATSLASTPGEQTAAGDIDANALGASEREVFERWADADGHVSHRDIDSLLRQNLLLRRIIADLVAGAGRPKPAKGHSGYVAEVPTDMIEQAYQYGDYSHIEDPEADGKIWF